MRRALLLALLLLGSVAHAQTTAAPAGTQINPNKVIIGTTPGTVAGGDAVMPVNPQIMALRPMDPASLPACAFSDEGSVVYVAGSIRSLCVCRPVNGAANGADGYLWSCPPP